jgi:hypothetical protein
MSRAVRFVSDLAYGIQHVTVVTVTPPSNGFQNFSGGWRGALFRRLVLFSGEFGIRASGLRIGAHFELAPKCKKRRRIPNFNLLAAHQPHYLLPSAINDPNSPTFIDRINQRELVPHFECSFLT